MNAINTESVEPRGMRIQSAALYTGLSHDTLEEHIKEGTIKTGMAKLKGASKGCRLICKKSLDAFLDGIFAGEKKGGDQ